MRQHPESSSEASEVSTSFWLAGADELLCGPLKEDLETDVLIVGAGITGLTTAYILAKEGIQVTVAERYSLGSGDTGRTTAHLTCMLDYPYSEIIQNHGKDQAAQVLASHLAALDWIEGFVREQGVPCHFKRLDGHLFLNPGDKMETLEKERESLEQLGYSRAQILLIPPPNAFFEGPSLRLPYQGRFHVYRYLRALAGAVLAQGGKIFPQTGMSEMNEQGGRTENGWHIKARSVVVATHAPVKAPFFFLKEAPYRTYALGSIVPKGVLHDALYWDTADPYHYIRLEPLNADKDLLIAGGADHKSGQPPEGDERNSFRDLEVWAKRHYPFVRDFSYRWSGQVMEPVDALAYIGRIPYRRYPVYLATGFSGNGMTYGTLSGMLLSDLILQRKNSWEKIYDPGRKSAKSLFQFVEENINAAVRFGRDWASKNDVPDPDMIDPGQGAVISKGMKKIACYRDDEGEIHAFSAVCTHLKCIVNWNKAERTFDCPCHGSRFSCRGEVLAGPANRPLEKMPLEAEAAKEHR